MEQQATISLHTLPDSVASLFQTITVPPYLLAHLIVVHDVAARLLAELRREWPELQLDREAILFGAATHDIGKVRHPEELLGSGEAHRLAGAQLLAEQGVPERWARFARTHGTRAEGDGILIEDLLVALADQVWSGRRVKSLENAVTRWIAQEAGIEKWEAYMLLDEILTALTATAVQRLSWQIQFLTEDQKEETFLADLEAELEEE